MRIVGAWRLETFQSRDEEGRPAHPLGERPAGLLIYTETGWMSVHVTHSDRVPFASPDPLQGTDAEQARAFATSFIAYSGRYDMQGDKVRHYVEVSVHPNWMGAVFERVFVLDGDTLVLRTQPIEIGSAAVVSELRWRRVG